MRMSQRMAILQRRPPTPKEEFYKISGILPERVRVHLDHAGIFAHTKSLRLTTPGICASTPPEGGLGAKQPFAPVFYAHSIPLNWLFTTSGTPRRC